MQEGIVLCLLSFIPAALALYAQIPAGMNSTEVAIRASGELSAETATIWATLIVAGNLKITAASIITGTLGVIFCSPNPINPACLGTMSLAVGMATVGAIMVAAGIAGDFLIGDPTPTELNSRLPEVFKRLPGYSSDAACINGMNTTNVEWIGLDEAFLRNNVETVGAEDTRNEESVLHFEKYGYKWTVNHDPATDTILVDIRAF